MLNRFFGAIAMSIGIAATAPAPSHAMSISSAARSISAAVPVHDVEFDERRTLPQQFFDLRYDGENRISSSVISYTLHSVFAALGAVHLFDR